MILILEDLHWADRPSLLLLEFLARELAASRLLVVGTYRDVEVSRRHPLALSLAELTREQLFQRILLRGLLQDDVARFIELVAGVLPPAALVEAVYRQTEGNPLFVTEVVRLLAQEGHLTGALIHASVKDSSTPDPSLIRIPEGIREVIGRRLDRSSERCNQVLTVASVIGREFTLGQLERLVDDLPRLRLLEVLEEALAARIIEELPRAAGRYQFTHALIQETLAEELSTMRRVQMHAQIADALEGLYGAEAEAHAAELAQHYAEAVSVSGTEKLVRYSLLAGERALASHAFEEAIGFFQQGLAAKEGGGLTGLGPAQDTETAALLFGLGRAQMATFPLHQISAAVVTMRRAFEYYEERGNVEQAVAVAECPPPSTAGVGMGASELTSRALALVPADSLEAARLLTLHGRLLGLEMADYTSALSALDRALAIARSADSPALQMRVLVDAAEVEGYLVSFPGAMDRARLAIDLSSVVDDPRAEMLAHYWCVLPLLQAGDPEGATPHAERSVAAAERLRHHFYIARALLGHAFISWLRGDGTSVRELTDRAMSISPLETRNVWLRARLECQLGEQERTWFYLDRLIDATRLMPPGPTLACGYCAASIGATLYETGDSSRLEIGEEMASAILSSPLAFRVVTDFARQCLAFIAVHTSNGEAAREQYQYFSGNEGSDVVVFNGPSDRRYLCGLLASTMGEPGLATSHFDDSLSFCRKAGYRPALAWTCVDYAHMLLEQWKASAPAGEGQRSKATELLDEGLRIARELGMRPLVERALRDKELLSA